MQLTGTHQERVEKLVEFALENNRHKVPIGQIAEAYQTAGIPFTESARAFFEKYSGLFKDCCLYSEKKARKIEFEFKLLADACSASQSSEAASELRKWYSPYEETSFGGI